MCSHHAKAISVTAKIIPLANMPDSLLLFQPLVYDPNHGGNRCTAAIRRYVLLGVPVRRCADSRTRVIKIDQIHRWIFAI